MGSVVNLAPELFQGVIARVPYVDLITELLEVDPGHGMRELGDVRIKAHYDYIRSYAPYENVTARDYPNLLVTGGYEDSQVQYWHPAKWVAKLRAHNTGSNLILLKTELEAGHAGASGRFDEIRDVALRHAFVLSLAGVRK
jgi:oligopeptidase B